MSKANSSPYQIHRFERSNSITSHFPATLKSKGKNMSRNSTKANTSKSKKSPILSPQPTLKKKISNAKEHDKTSASNRKESREGLVMTNSLNIPHLSPASHSEFTRNSSLQFTTHICDQSSHLYHLAQLFQRTQATLQKYEQTTLRLTTKNKEISKKLVLANQQILQLQRQLRKSKEL